MRPRWSISSTRTFTFWPSLRKSLTFSTRWAAICEMCTKPSVPGMIVTLGTMAYIFGTAPMKTLADGSTQPDVVGSTAGIIAVVAANLYVVFFGMSWGPVVWVLLGEMFNNRIRAAALAVAASAQWVANFAVSTTFPPMSKGLGLGASYSIYAAFAALSFVFVLRWVKETKGRELESM